MKKLLIPLVFVVSVATVFFFQTGTVNSSKYSLEIPPIIIKPPYKLQETKSTVVIANTKTLTMNIIKTV